MKRKLATFMGAAMAAATIFAPFTVSAEAERNIKVITIWNEDSEGTLFMKNLTEKYQEEHPEVSVEFEVVSQDGLNEKISVLAASNDLPDVFLCSQPATVRNFAEQGLLANLEEKLSELEMDGVLSQEIIQSIAKRQGTDALYVMPTQNNIEGFFYNKTIFEENEVEVPTNMDEFMEVCQKLSDNDIQPLTSAGAEKWPITRLLGGYITQLGGVDSLIKANKGECSWSEDEFIQGYQWLKDLGEAGYLGLGVTTLDTDTANMMFLSGQAAMLYNGSWFTSNINSDANTLGDNIGFFAFPAIEGGKGTGNNYVSSTGLNWCFNAAKWDDALADWFKFVFTNYGDQALTDAGMITPYTLNEEHEVSYSTQMILDAMEKGGDLAVWPEFYVDMSVGNVIYEQGQMLVLGAVEPEEAGAAIDEAMAAAAK